MRSPRSSDTVPYEQLITVELHVTPCELAHLALHTDRDPELGNVSLQLDRVFDRVREHPGQTELNV